MTTKARMKSLASRVVRDPKRSAMLPTQGAQVTITMMRIVRVMPKTTEAEAPTSSWASSPRATEVMPVPIRLSAWAQNRRWKGRWRQSEELSLLSEEVNGRGALGVWREAVSLKRWAMAENAPVQSWWVCPRNHSKRHETGGGRGRSGYISPSLGKGTASKRPIAG